MLIIRVNLILCKLGSLFIAIATSQETVWTVSPVNFYINNHWYDELGDNKYMYMYLTSWFCEAKKNIIYTPPPPQKKKLWIEFKITCYVSREHWVLILH